MRTFKIISILSITLIIFLESGESLRCYVCRSDEDPDCGFNQNHIESCLGIEELPPVCRKITQRLTFLKEEKYTMIRECGAHTNAINCYKLNWSLIAEQETCECHGELCNSSYRVVANLLVTFAFWFLDFLSW